MSTSCIMSSSLADVFNTSIHPDDLFNIVSKDLATQAIEESLLSTAAFGRAKMEEFVTQKTYRT